MLGRNVLVAELRKLVVRAKKHGAQPVRDTDLHATPADAWQPADLRTELLNHHTGRQVQLFQHLGHHTIALFQQCQQQMLRLDLAIAVALGQVLCRNDRFLRFLRPTVGIKRHGCSPPCGMELLVVEEQNNARRHYSCQRSVSIRVGRATTTRAGRSSSSPKVYPVCTTSTTVSWSTSASCAAIAS